MLLEAARDSAIDVRLGVVFEMPAKPHRDVVRRLWDAFTGAFGHALPSGPSRVYCGVNNQRTTVESLADVEAPFGKGLKVARGEWHVTISIDQGAWIFELRTGVFGNHLRVLAPPTTDAAALEQFARSLVELAPIVAGVGGWLVVSTMANTPDETHAAAFRLLRAYPGVCITGHEHGWRTDRLRDVGWLTLLGGDLVAQLGDRLETVSGDVARHDGQFGTLLRAGDSPSAESTPARTEVARAVEPILATTYTIPTGSGDTETQVTVFEEHHATKAYLRRFIEPAFGERTPRERAEQLLELLAPGTKLESRRWENLMQALYNATTVSGADPGLVIEALEITSNWWWFGVGQSRSQLLFHCLRQRDFERAIAWMPRAYEHGDAMPTTYHNAACIFASMGRIDDAIDAVRRAKAAGYSGMEALRTDEGLGALRERDEFREIFEPSPQPRAAAKKATKKKPTSEKRPSTSKRAASAKSTRGTKSRTARARR